MSQLPPFPKTATPSPLVGRVLGLNPGMMTGPGTNTYVIGRDELALVLCAEASHALMVAAGVPLAIADRGDAAREPGDRHWAFHRYRRPR